MLCLAFCTLATGQTGSTQLTSMATAVRPAEMVTKHARYVAAEWSTLTDWTADASDEALAAFLRGCRSLGPKPPWTAVCADGRKLVGKSRREAREFFEAHFDAYQLRSNTENSDTGLLTGYFEPVVRGSRTKQPGLEVPVYAKPRDLLLLDRKQLIGTRFGAAVTAVVSGGVLTLPRDEAPSQPTADFVNRVRLMLPPDVPATADRKLRVRIDGDTLVPYFSRQELRGRETLDAEVLAWVETEDAVYLMQMQGCGRILFQDGTHLRVGYADQNGHTFAPQGREGLASKGVGTGIPLTATAAPGSENAEVLRIIEMFRSAAGPEPTQPYRPATLSPRHTGNDQPLVTTPTRRDETSPRPNDVPAGLFASAIRSDPSYVFFRRIGPHEPGPIGALGVGLTPERSIAVDPRTTPLGSPVFMSAEGQTSQKLRRLVVAQDTGGAIRGAVRADFYWGPGSIAGARALQTRDPLRLWVLLPKSMRGSMHRLAPLVSKGALDQSPPSECLVADDEFCLE